MRNLKKKIAILPILLLSCNALMSLSVNTVNAQDANDQIILAQAESEPDYSTGTVVTHTVKPGEYLYKIARDYGVTVNELRLWNHLTSDLLQIGQQLKIIPNTQTPPPSSGTIHTVRAGDTLWRIANQYGVSVSQLMQWNNLSSDFLSIGMRLYVTPQNTTPPPGNEFTYTVRAGDTLWSIAYRYGVTVNQLKQWNGLTSDFLSIGMQLNIAGSTTPPPAQGTVYTVRAGDTLWNIAYRYGVTVNQLMQWNGLTSDFLSIGMMLRVTGP